MYLKLAMFIYFLTFLTADAKSQKLFKRTNFQPSDWSKLIYKSVDIKVKTKTECLGLCLVESVKCNVVFFDEDLNSCFLGTMGSNFSVVANTSVNMDGYVDIGNLFVG